MKNIFNVKRFAVLLATILVLVGSRPSFAAATIEIRVIDGPGEGFNDPAPAAPVGGNTGTTVGQQRLIAFQFAAGIWGSTLDSNQTIVIQAAFNPLAPGVLGSAGATEVFSDFESETVGLYPGPEFPATWYGSALADKRAGADLNEGRPDINTQFSSNFNFYLGLDNNHGPLNDLVAVLLHEFAHGLNFQNFVNESTGTNLSGQTDIYARHTLDITTGLYWDQMTDAERRASAIRFGRVVWDGINVTAAVPIVLSFGSPEVKGNSPASIAKPFQFGTAAFGPAITSLPGQITANVVAAQDAANVAGSATTDGCSAVTNASDVAGKIALIERGGCTFVVKAKNAQNAGAVAVIIYNNAANATAGPPGMAGVDPTITIPSISLNRTDGLAIAAESPNGNMTIGPNFSVRAGADPAGRARLFMPDPVQGGSSGSHYDSIAFRNLLMEPAISPDLTHNVKAPEDLTLELFRDIGWFPDADLDGVADDTDCEPNSNLSSTVVINGCESGVANTLFNNGCTFSDRIAQIAAGAKNHGKFVTGVTNLLNALRKDGTITTAQRNALQKCASRKP